MMEINELFDIFDDDGERQKFNDRQKKLRDKELDDLKLVLERPEGRRLIWRMLAACGVFRNSFTGNSQTFYNEGQRNIGLLILKDIMESKPEAFTQMQREFISNKASEQAAEKNKEASHG